MAKFHPLQVSDIQNETKDCVSIAFQIPPHLQQEFAYLAGQYVTLKLTIEGDETRRSYSICSSPVDTHDFRIAAKRVENGKMSIYLNERLKKGDIVEVMPPMGNFHSPINSSNKKNYVLFAGGSGITPIISIIKTILKSEPLSTLSLFYGNYNEDAIIFQKQLTDLAAENKNRFNIYHILDKPNHSIAELYTGIMTPTKVRSLIEQHVGLNLDNEFFICGPTAMMKNVEDILLSLQIPKNKIHLEYFTATLDANEKQTNDTTDKNITSQVTIILDGSETILNINSDGPVILDAALEADLDVPFACKGAVCCTCRAKVLEGKVNMKANFALTEDEVAEGFILTCQSHPITPTLVVDYDV